MNVVCIERVKCFTFSIDAVARRIEICYILSVIYTGRRNFLACDTWGKEFVGESHFAILGWDGKRLRDNLKDNRRIYSLNTACGVNAVTVNSDNAVCSI